MQDTVELFEEHIPEKLEEVKDAFIDFIDELSSRSVFNLTRI